LILRSGEDELCWIFGQIFAQLKRTEGRSRGILACLFFARSFIEQIHLYQVPPIDTFLGRA